MSEDGAAAVVEPPPTRARGTYVYVCDVVYSGEYDDGAWRAQVQVIGRRADKRSVTVRVRGNQAYFYCTRALREDSSGAVDAVQLERVLEGYLANHASGLRQKPEREAWRRNANTRSAEQLDATRVTVACTRKTSIYEYQAQRDIFCISITHPCAVPVLRDAIVNGLIDSALTSYTPRAYDANVDFVMRFMVDTGVRCHAWICVDDVEEQEDMSSCTSPDMICPTPESLRIVSDDEEIHMNLRAHLVIQSFDIECAAKLGTFPDPEIDPVIQIASDFVVYDGRNSEEIAQTSRAVLLALRDTDPIAVGADVDTRCFEDEGDLLLAFAALVRAEDPDVITSWNGPNFDWKYIVSRTKHLGLAPESRMFSRLHRVQMRNRERASATKAHGHKADNQVEAPGRFIFDMMGPIMVNNKLRSYKLDDVAFHFLRDRKDDVPHTEITRLWNKDAHARGVLGAYCVQDARLPRRLLVHTVMLLQYLEMARVCRVPSSYLTTRGQQIKVFALILYYSREDGFVVPFTPRTDAGGPAAAVTDQDVTYEGATVIEPDRGFYTTPVVTLDFASLYPSIMIADNESHDTWFPGGKLPSEIHQAAAAADEQLSAALAAVTGAGAADTGGAAATAARTESEDVRAARAKAAAAASAVAALVVHDGKEAGRPLVDKDVRRMPSGEVFVRTKIRTGILSKILVSLLAARGRSKKAKTAAEESADSHMYAVYDARQLALKVSANSVYGFTGVTYGVLPCKAIAASVTARGREMIVITTRIVEETYARLFAEKYGGHARVIYGDTDSVMVLFPCSVAKGPDGKLVDISFAIQESFLFAIECSKAANATFRKPHNLQVEKTFYPYLLINKKRYAGGYYEYRWNKMPETEPECIKTMGIEVVRRDNSKMLPRQLQAALDALMYDLAPERAIACVQESVEAIINGPQEASDIAVACVEVAERDLVALLADPARGGFDTQYAQLVGFRFRTAYRAVVCANYEGAAAAVNATALSPHASEKDWLAAIPGALEFAHQGLSDNNNLSDELGKAVSSTLRLNVSQDDFVISKKYGRPFHLYAGKQPHIEMLKRMDERAAAGTSEYAGQYKRYLGDRVDFLVVAQSATYVGNKITDRGEDPGMAKLLGLQPDTVYYLQQLLRPLGRILKPLVGRKSDAYRRIMSKVRDRPRPDRGFTIDRFKSKEALYIWGHYKDGRRKRPPVPAVVERNAARIAAAKYEADVARARASGEAPPPPPKRARAVGPLDAFFLGPDKVAAATQTASAALALLHTTAAVSTRPPMVSPATIATRASAVHAKAVASAHRIAEGTGEEVELPVIAQAVGPLDAFFQVGGAAAAAASLAAVGTSKKPCRNVIIQSTPCDDIEKAMQHNVWASLKMGEGGAGLRKRGNAAIADYYEESEGNVWLYFTKYKSFKIFGVARMASPPDGPPIRLWAEPDKYGGTFKLEWISKTAVDMPASLKAKRILDTDTLDDESARYIMREVMKGADADMPLLRLARAQVLS